MAPNLPILSSISFSPQGPITTYTEAVIQRAKSESSACQQHKHSLVTKDHNPLTNALISQKKEETANNLIHRLQIYSPSSFPPATASTLTDDLDNLTTIKQHLDIGADPFFMWAALVGVITNPDSNLVSVSDPVLYDVFMADVLPREREWLRFKLRLLQLRLELMELQRLWRPLSVEREQELVQLQVTLNVVRQSMGLLLVFEANVVDATPVTDDDCDSDGPRVV